MNKKTMVYLGMLAAGLVVLKLLNDDKKKAAQASYDAYVQSLKDNGSYWLPDSMLQDMKLGYTAPVDPGLCDANFIWSGICEVYDRVTS